MKIVQRQREECRIVSMRCKIYYKGIEIERKYIRKELDRKLERNNIKRNVIRIRKWKDKCGRKIL